MNVTIHQPEFAPWMGLFDKVLGTDLFILLDDVEFEKNYFQNRNRVRTANGWSWITVPVHHGATTPIDEVTIAKEDNPRWSEKILKTVYYNYHNADHFERVHDALESFLEGCGERLVTLNIPLLEWMLDEYELSPKVVRSSALDVESAGSQRILDICREVGADTYLSGVSGRDYLDLGAFEDAGVDVTFQEFHHPIYEQEYEPFIPRMSALEPLMLFGSEASDLLEPGWPERVDEVAT